MTARANKPPTLPTVLLTGFDPFGGETENPSWEAVRVLQGTRIAGHRIETRCLPVVFGDAIAQLRKALAATKPALVVCVGQAGGRAQVSLERIAINVDDARRPDNAGRSPIDAAIIADGPAGYFSTLPIKRLREALQRAGIPAEISQTAGTFVCNHVFYGLMHALRTRRGVRGGFVHIPFSPAQAAQHPGAPSLPVETVTQALRLVVRTALMHPQDLPIPVDATH
jgi:pyroglutamyl-peptidase